MNVEPGSTCFKINDIVLLQEVNTPRLLWKMGRVLSIYPGRDNRVRACEVLLANGNKIRRPIQMLCPLEVQSSGDDANVASNAAGRM